MRRLSARSAEEQVVLHETRNVDYFADSHPYRVRLARKYIGLAIEDLGHPAAILELGVGCGDISGPFSIGGMNQVVGIDCALDSKTVCAEMYPHIEHIERRLENIRPRGCDILVACEILEHLGEPWSIFYEFAMRAQYLVIGHPLDEPDGAEPLHLWRYDKDDFNDWFKLTGHKLREREIFGLGPFPNMILGWGGVE